MIDVNNPNAILAAKMCGDLFTNDSVKAKKEFKVLAQMYHPDRNKSKQAEEVFKKIKELYNTAKGMIESGKWAESDCIEFDTKDGKRKKLKFIKECKFELGVQYISSSIITYVLEAQNKKYFDNAIKRIGSLGYEHDAMEKEFSRYFPEFIETFETEEGKWVLVIKKTKDLIRLQDLLDFYKGNINDRHVAWMMSRLSNICCFIEYNGITHNGISLENCFVSPEYHSIALLGGWWYCVGRGEKMFGTQKQIYDIMGPLTKTNKIGSVTTDLESVKLIGRTLLGKTQAPDSFRNWLNSGSSGIARNEYTKWSQALDRAYGERRFIKLEATEQEVYNLKI